MRHITHQVDLCVVGGAWRACVPPSPPPATGPAWPSCTTAPSWGQRLLRGPHVGLRSPRVQQPRDGPHRRDRTRQPAAQPAKIYPLWDALLYEKVRLEPNITLLLNCSCLDATMRGDRLASVRGWQGTAETWHTVEAALLPTAPETASWRP